FDAHGKSRPRHAELKTIVIQLSRLAHSQAVFAGKFCNRPVDCERGTALALTVLIHKRGQSSHVIVFVACCGRSGREGCPRSNPQAEVHPYGVESHKQDVDPGSAHTIVTSSRSRARAELQRSANLAFE